MQNDQGVKVAVATPHFYADDESVEHFTARRRDAYLHLVKSLPKGAPLIRLGAEVRYYQGISKLPELSKLKIEGTDCILLEMPDEKISEYTLSELSELSGKKNQKIILAHIERYIDLQRPETWDRMLGMGIKMQVNASFVTSFMTRRRALNMLGNGEIHFIGSDCHSVDRRPPRIGKAFEYIEAKFGSQFVNQINEYGYSVLVKNINK